MQASYSETRYEVERDGVEYGGQVETPAVRWKHGGSAQNSQRARPHTNEPIALRMLVADPMSMCVSFGLHGRRRCRFVVNVARMRNWGSTCLLCHGISRQTAPRPLPLTQPFWLKSNWPIIRPSYNGSAVSSTVSSRIQESPSRDRITPAGMSERGIGQSVVRWLGAAGAPVGAGNVAGLQQVAVDEAGFGLRGARGRRWCRTASPPVRPPRVAVGMGSMPSSAHNSLMGRQSPRSQRLYSSGR